MLSSKNFWNKYLFKTPPTSGRCAYEEEAPYKKAGDHPHVVQIVGQKVSFTKQLCHKTTYLEKWQNIHLLSGISQLSCVGFNKKLFTFHLKPVI